MKFPGRSTSVILLAMLFGVSGASAETTADSEIIFNPVADSIAIGTGLLSVVLSEYLLYQVQPGDIPSPSIDSLNPIDRMAVFKYSDSLDLVSDIAQYTAFLSPAFLAIGTASDDWPEIALLYAEAGMISWGIKNVLKLAVTRYRPFLYQDDVPEKLVADGDYANSFPSGHATMAFTGASFLTFMFDHFHPQSSWSIPVAIGSYSIAAATAAFRIFSGNHFITDVVVGAAIGTAVGIVVPWLHLRQNNENTDAAVALTFGADLSTIGVRVQF